MSKLEPIIDINPVASTSDKRSTAESASNFRAPSFGKQVKQTAGQAMPYTTQTAQATVIGSGGTAVAGNSDRVGGVVQTAVGGALVLLGVPMLILPGPGLLAIGGGAALAAKGIKKMRGK